MKKARQLSNLCDVVICLLIAFLFLLFASYFTSPLTSIYGSDAAFFQMVGQAMTKGFLPYRDFFDMKGPYLFLVQYLAQLISYGRFGCFLMQLIHLTATLWFACRCIRMGRQKRNLWVELLLLIPCAVVLCTTMDGGNLTEELALPLLLGSLYILLHAMQQDAAPASHLFKLASRRLRPAFLY